MKQRSAAFICNLLIIASLVLLLVEPPWPRSWTWPVLAIEWLLIVVAFCVYVRRNHRAALHDHRFARGLCLDCGYDLRGRNSRCPECGRAVDPRLT